MRRALLLLGLAVTGCTDASRSVFIYHNLGCGASSPLPRGRLDTQESPDLLPGNGGYWFAPVVQNEASSDAAMVRGAHITVEMPDDFFGPGVEPPAAFVQEASFDEPFSGTVDPNGGRMAFGMWALPRALMRQYLEERIGLDPVPVRLHVTIFGELGGGDFEAMPYTYNIDVCGGCMITDLGPCELLPDGFTGSPGGSCNAVQDLELECCELGGERVCPAAPPASP
jgi:hypothetical protein